MYINLLKMCEILRIWDNEIFVLKIDLKFYIFTERNFFLLKHKVVL